MPVNIAIFASGNGSNAENLMSFAKELEQEKDKFLVTCIVTDKENAGVILKAKKYGVPVEVVEPLKEESKNEYEKRILEALSGHQVDWIFLAGYMRLLSSDFIAHFYDKELDLAHIVNIHPSLLPSFSGRNVYRRVYESGVKISGVTVHFLDAGVDTGPILLQTSFERLEDESFEQFQEKGLKVEHELYRKAAICILKEQVFLKNIPDSNKKIIYIKKDL